MLEVRYIKVTGEITAWVSSPEFNGGHLAPKDGEEIMVIDSPTPTYPPENYLIIGGQLELVKQPDDAQKGLIAQIEDLKAELKAKGLID